MEIHFLSNNRYKIAEVQAIFGPKDVHVVATQLKIEELQTEDVEALVRDKVLKAFLKIGRPLFVEHTGLHLAGLNGLPGGLTQIFWDRLGPESFATLVNSLPSQQVTAKTTIGYCDSRRIHYFEGEIKGIVPKCTGWEPRISVGLRLRPRRDFGDLCRAGYQKERNFDETKGTRQFCSSPIKD